MILQSSYMFLQFIVPVDIVTIITVIAGHRVDYWRLYRLHSRAAAIHLMSLELFALRFVLIYLLDVAGVTFHHAAAAKIEPILGVCSFAARCGQGLRGR